MPRSFLFLILSPQLGVGKKLGEAQLGQLTPPGQRDIPNILCYAQQQRLREDEEGNNCGDK